MVSRRKHQPKLRMCDRLRIGQMLRHKFLGKVIYTGGCYQLMQHHIDPSSIYVEQDGEILEVSVALLSEEV